MKLVLLTIFLLFYSCVANQSVKETIGTNTPKELVDNFAKNPAGLKIAPEPVIRKVEVVDNDLPTEEVVPENHSKDEEDCPPEFLTDHSKQIEKLSEQSQNVEKKSAADTSCTHYKKFLESGINKDALKQALTYYSNNPKKIKNSKFISIADFSMNSRRKRYYLLNMDTGEIEKEKVSHGSGKINGTAYGDKDHDGMIDQCKLTPKQLSKVNKARKEKGKNPTHSRWAMTRPGFYTTKNLANSHSHDPLNRSRGAWPMFSTEPKRLNKLLMDGHTKGVNDDALRNGVVMHEANYNKNRKMGRSFGCPAFKPHVGRRIAQKIKNGSLYYAYVQKCPDDMDIVEKQVPQWKLKCED